LFREFDKDRNAYLDKCEMSQLLAKCFGIEVPIPQIKTTVSSKKWKDLQSETIIEEGSKSKPRRSTKKQKPAIQNMTSNEMTP
jgi:hypothetical protein